MGNGPGVHHVGISPDGRRLYAVDRERTVFMFDTALQRLTARMSVNKGTSHLAVHPRSGRCTSASAALIAWSGSTRKLFSRAGGSPPAKVPIYRPRRKTAASSSYPDATAS